MAHEDLTREEQVEGSLNRSLGLVFAAVFLIITCWPLNTSFNVRGEPIVCTPEDAFRCFMGSELDVLAVGNFYVRKEQQDPVLKQNYETAFELD